MKIPPKINIAWMSKKNDLTGTDITFVVKMQPFSPNKGDPQLLTIVIHSFECNKKLAKTC